MSGSPLTSEAVATINMKRATVITRSRSRLIVGIIEYSRYANVVLSILCYELENVILGAML